MDERNFSINLGSSRLVLRPSDHREYHHFAINIHPDDFEFFLKFVREELKPLPWEGKDTIDFPNWNARAVYFYDPAGNIVEFIAREGIKQKYSSPQGGISDKIIRLSEIGLPTSDVSDIADTIKSKAEIDRYDGDKSRFCAAGDEEGMFIIVDYKQKKWIPMMDDVIPFPFAAMIENKGKRYRVRYEGERLWINKIPIPEVMG